jgi:hypothetical protein
MQRGGRDQPRRALTGMSFRESVAASQVHSFLIFDPVFVVLEFEFLDDGRESLKIASQIPTTVKIQTRSGRSAETITRSFDFTSLTANETPVRP